MANEKLQFRLSLERKNIHTMAWNPAVSQSPHDDIQMSFILIRDRQTPQF